MPFDIRTRNIFRGEKSRAGKTAGNRRDENDKNARFHAVLTVQSQVVVSEYGRPGPVALHGHAHRPVVGVHVHLFHAGVASGERPDGRQGRTDAGQLHFFQGLRPHAAVDRPMTNGYDL